MAAQAIDVRERRDQRLVVLVSDREKERIASRARDAAMSMSDWLRTAGEQYDDPTKTEKLLLADLIETLKVANAKTAAALQRLEKGAERRASFDEAAYMQQLTQSILARNDIDWDAFAEDLHLASAKSQ